MINNFFPVPTNSPTSLFESYLAPVSFSFLKWRIMGRIALWDCLRGGQILIKVPSAGLRSNRLKICRPKPELCRPKFHHAQQHSDIPITHFFSCACFVSSRLKERDVFHVSHCLVIAYKTR